MSARMTSAAVGNSRASDSRRSCERAASASRAPSTAKTRAMASPIPIEAPVISATLPSSLPTSRSYATTQPRSVHLTSIIALMAAEVLLPVFPLQVVLFPRTEIPLHIFEERYKEMIGECIEARSEFGIVLVIEQGV